MVLIWEMTQPKVTGAIQGQTLPKGGLCVRQNQPMRAHRPFAYTERFRGLLNSKMRQAATRMNPMKITWPLALALFAAAAANAAAPKFDAEAVRLNNRGVALMGQQSTELAAQAFAQASKKDPKLAQAAINQGIALLYLQKTDESKQVLQAALALEPGNAQAWYNLGLAQHAGFELEPALASFQNAVKADARDADSYY